MMRRRRRRNEDDEDDEDDEPLDLGLAFFQTNPNYSKWTSTDSGLSAAMRTSPAENSPNCWPSLEGKRRLLTGSSDFTRHTS